MLKKIIKFFSALIIILVLVLVIFLLVLKIQNRHQPEPLPEVSALIYDLPVLLEIQQRQNAAAGFMGITAPAGTDYIGIGAAIMVDNRQAIIDGLKVPSFDEAHSLVFTIKNYLNGQAELGFYRRVNGQFYKFACSIPENDDCIAQTLEDRGVIETLIARNSELMERYLEIIRLPEYNSYTYRITEMFPLSWSIIDGLGDLRLAQAILALNDGYVDEAYAILYEELAFIKLMLQGDGPLIEKMLIIEHLNRFYQTLDRLMVHHQWLRSFSVDQWRELISPLSEHEQRGWGKGVIHDRVWSVFGVYTFNASSFSDDKENMFEQLAVDMAYNRVTTANIAYLSWQPVFELGILDQTQLSTLKVQSLLTNLASQRVQIVQEQNEVYAQQYGVIFNVMGKELFDLSHNGEILTKEFYRFYNAQIYMALISVKYEILNAGISADEVSAYLESLGTKALNPFTQEPFIWDEEAQELRARRFIEPGDESETAKPEVFVHIILSK